MKHKQAMVNMLTVRDVIRWCATQLSQAGVYLGHGTDNYWDEALALVLAVIRFEPEFGDKIIEARLSDEEKATVLDLLDKRIHQRIPMPYLTQQAWFAGLRFYVNNHVLIPRSPIAELIEQQFELWIEPFQVQNLLDLGTGSGCLAIASALAFPDAQVDAVDIDPQALAVAQKNVTDYQLTQQIQLIQSDVFDQLAGKVYDIIIANPPYVDQQDMDELPAEYRHEPRHALASGDDGLDCTRKILQQAKHYLSPHGILVCEVGNSAVALEQAFPELPFLWVEFERGGHGVFLLTQAQLVNHF